MIHRDTPIVVVGMGCAFPGAMDIPQFWNNIVNKFDATIDVPRNRWIADPDVMVSTGLHEDRPYSRRACLATNFIFDPSLYDTDSDLLIGLDPIYHMVLHAGKSAWAGCMTQTVDPERVGTILAAIVLPSDGTSAITRRIFGRFLENGCFPDHAVALEKTKKRQDYFNSRVSGLPAALLANELKVSGGSYTLDAACASSLYAVKLACDRLVSGEADMMITGGVSRPDCLYTQTGFSQLRALSPSGRCAPFDHRADGLVVGEGSGVLILKRLPDALQHGDTIHAVIRGMGLSNDMRGNLLAPDNEGQLRAMRKAYASAEWQPHEIDHIECHGAGTPVGDATELKSLRMLWGETGWTKGQCAIGSVKSMIGHLLTAAGAAGMIKTVLALENKTLPPSLNFEKPAKSSPLIDSAFRVQTMPEEWRQRTPSLPRRAAVSAFGFGGINAHVLFEEFSPECHGDPASPKYYPSAHPKAPEIQPFSDYSTSSETPTVAVIGMAATFPHVETLTAFQHLIFNGDTIIDQRPADRWKGADDLIETLLQGRARYGAYFSELPIEIGEFQIPPNEIPQILPQQLIMLKTARDALLDAGMPVRASRPEMGTVIGINYDFNATNFHLRWRLLNGVREWRRRYGLDLDEKALQRWLTKLEDGCGEPMNAPRVLGALGGIVASRVAREFKFGGPSFVVSADEVSGLRALEIGVRVLQQNEVKSVLVGAVDLCGDARAVICNDAESAFSSQNEIYPFDRRADGTLPGEGAVALVLKHLDEAVADGDRIYAVVRGMGTSSGSAGDDPRLEKNTYLRSLSAALSEAHVDPPSVGLFETHGSGIVFQDELEIDALHHLFTSGNTRRDMACAIGTVKPNIGHAGAAAGLTSVIKTALCLYHEIIPPLRNFQASPKSVWDADRFHLPAFPQFWMRNRIDGPRRACVGALTADGNCAHVVMEAFEAKHPVLLPEIVDKERKRPLGPKPYGLFVVEGNDAVELICELESLEKFLQKPAASPTPTDFRRRAFNSGDLEYLAHAWFAAHPLDASNKQAVTLVGKTVEQLLDRIEKAKAAVESNRPCTISETGGIAYSPAPLGAGAKVAVVFPGSGNHYVSMGRDIGTHWPDIPREMDAETDRLSAQFFPQDYYPHRISWERDWERRALRRIESDPLKMIFGQVCHGGLMWRLMRRFLGKPDAVIGYSLGETAALFAMKVWPDRGEMLERMRRTDLFTTALTGHCTAARKAWGIPDDQEFSWSVAAVNRPAAKVKRIIGAYSQARLLIVNTPQECVIGGEKRQVEAVIRDLRCESVPLKGVATVHCDAAGPVADAYRELHRFPTAALEDITIYSCGFGDAYDPTTENAAESITKQALEGFDFNHTIMQAYKAGIRIFVEMGPRASSTRMIRQILKDKPHMAVSACMRGEDDDLTLIKCLGSLIAQRVPVHLNMLYGDQAYPPGFFSSRKKISEKTIVIPVGGKPLTPVPPPENSTLHRAAAESSPPPLSSEWKSDKVPATPVSAPPLMDSSPDKAAVSDTDESSMASQFAAIIQTMSENIQATSRTHDKFLEFSDDLTRSYGKTFEFQNRLLELGAGEDFLLEPLPQGEINQRKKLPPLFDRRKCMEFAVGSVAAVLGPEFAAVDNYNVRVRLPDEPLMLVDRILSVQGEKLTLTSGRVVTEHDVLPGVWYLDGDRAPVCISVEAGQADLFLSSYLGIDHRVKGERTYRLLDAVVTFHRGLPRPGETIRYDIRIEKFVRQGETYLFFFNFDGHIGDEHLITMREGCAGFFTAEEVEKSGGILVTEAEKAPLPGKRRMNWKPPVPVGKASYDDARIEALRRGDLGGCFGEAFRGIVLPESLRLPGGRMRLIHRVLSLDPEGGRYGMGSVRAEADIHPDDWFLTCHFVDDMVMPGTLMYECCAHTLRVYLQRMGWVTDKPGVCYEPVIGIGARLKCRGPVTPETKQVHYEIQIKEMGYGPEPYVVADAHMFGDGRRIVYFENMSLKMTGLSREEIDDFWGRRHFSTPNRMLDAPRDALPAMTAAAVAPRSQDTLLFTHEQILAFAVGNPSECYGEPYKIFDRQRRIARLPGPPYCFLDGITTVEPDACQLKPDGWVEAVYEVKENEWYFNADRTGAMPFCVLLEIVLQPCGWLAAYMGSALRSEKDLKFRNLGGTGRIHANVLRAHHALTMRTRCTKVSEAADMIIENFDFQVLSGGKPIYTGDTYFGFFTEEALKNQVGLGKSDQIDYRLTEKEVESAHTHHFTDAAPITPYEAALTGLTAPYGLSMPAKALRMIDRVTHFLPNGGPNGLGYARGTKKVDPDEWFFKAHFYQDPVCPGSLGVESLIQIFKFMAVHRWHHLEKSHRFEGIIGEPHNWIYRGQIIPDNKIVEIEAVVTRIHESPVPTLIGNGWLKVDGLFIYKMENFGIRLVPDGG